MSSQTLTEALLNRIEQQFSGNGSSASSQRILNEYRGLVKLPSHNISFDNNNNIYIWTINLDATLLQLTPQLVNDFNTYQTRTGKKKEIVLEIRFQSNYPFSPPFIRVVSPRFVFHTGHVTIGGSLCSQRLTTSGWNATYILETLIMEIISDMNEGGARLDFSSFRDYTLQEAQEAFFRVARQHGWQ